MIDSHSSPLVTSAAVPRPQAYVGPLMVVNFYLVLITLLQHTHPALPHYDEAEWDWLRGALSTVDRDYGFLNYCEYEVLCTVFT